MRYTVKSIISPHRLQMPSNSEKAHSFWRDPIQRTYTFPSTFCPTPRKLLDPCFCSRSSFMKLKIGGILKSCSFYFTDFFVKCICDLKVLLYIIIVYGILCYLRTFHKNTYCTLCMLRFTLPIFPVFTILLSVSLLRSLEVLLLLSCYIYIHDFVYLYAIWGSCIKEKVY